MTIKLLVVLVLVVLKAKRVIPCEKRIMKKTILQDIKKIEEGLSSGKSYEQIAQDLSLSLRVVRKWGQLIKKGVL